MVLSPPHLLGKTDLRGSTSASASDLRAGICGAAPSHTGYHQRRKYAMSIFIFLIIIICAWQAFYYVGVDLLELAKPYAVPSPIGVGQRLVELCSDGAPVSGYRKFAAARSGRICHCGADRAGVGLLMNHFKFLGKNLKPIVLGIQTPSQCLLGAFFHPLVRAFHAGDPVRGGDGICLQHRHFRYQTPSRISSPSIKKRP